MDPGSGENVSRISDPGVEKAPDPGSLIRIHNTDKGINFNIISIILHQKIFCIFKPKKKKYARISLKNANTSIEYCWI